VAKKLQISPIPSAYQIRYAGCKGVLAIHPALGDEDKVHIRRSMKKFESDHTSLEVMYTTRPGIYMPLIFCCSLIYTAHIILAHRSKTDSE
jgi:RNA-dependent RNA polymerase